MTQNPIIASPLDNIQNSLQVLIKNEIHQGPVARNGKPVGIVTDRDPKIALSDYVSEPSPKVGSVMSREPVTVTNDLKIAEAAKIIHKRRFNALPIVNKKAELVDILTIRGILDGLINLFEIQNNLRKLENRKQYCPKTKTNGEPRHENRKNTIPDRFLGVL
jgi:predicted transcriptional regulator